MKTIPKSLSKFFWDTDISQLQVDNHRNYVIARLLHLGDESALRWLRQTYTNDQILQCVHHSRELSAKDKNFYSLVY